MTRGRPPKPLALHVLQGTYRADRHGPKDAEAETAGEITKPKGLSAGASRLWDTLTAQLKPVLRPTDACLLEALCQLFDLAHKSMAKAQKNPTDRATRGAAIGYLTAADRIAVRFGLTPIDRQKLHIPPAPDAPDGMETLLNRRPRVASRKRD